MDKLMTMMFGEDFLQYDYDKKICQVIDNCKPNFMYVREDWNEEYFHMIVSDDLSMCTGEEGESSFGCLLKMTCSGRLHELSFYAT